MTKIKKLLCIITVLPLVIKAQGIQGFEWTSGLSLQQVKQKAKEENKYIFIDAYTTWCGPCKAMDKQVYANDTVAKFFKEKFVSVKVQMDQTKSDNEQIKSWYQDAQSIAKQYHIEAYPSFIFLSPAGDIVHMDIGFKKVPEFIEVAKTALIPDKIYKDPYADYNKLVSEYNAGIERYDSMTYMIEVALKLQDNDLALRLVKDHTDYVITLPKKSRYTKENIKMWSLFSIASKTRIFQFFYKDGRLIDKVMDEKGYAERIVDRTIKEEIIDPFFKEENKDSSISMSGMMLSGKGLNANLSEADWEKLKQKIQAKYSSKYVERNVLKAKSEWYKRHRNNIAYSKTYLLLLKKYPPDFTNLNEVSGLNSIGWSVFMSITDKKIIDETIKAMEKMFKQNRSTPDSQIVGVIDTYANLLYKGGRIKEAINWERRAVNAAAREQSKKQFNKALDQMSQGEPTYGAVWGYK